MYLSVPCTCPPDKSHVCAECLRKQQGPTRYLTYLDQTQVPPYPPPGSPVSSTPKSKTRMVVETPCYGCSQKDRFPVPQDHCRCPVFSRIISSSPPWICYACNKYIERDPSFSEVRLSSKSFKEKSVDTQVFQKDLNRIPEESDSSGVGCPCDVIIPPPPAFRSPGDTSSKSFSSSPSLKPNPLRMSSPEMFQSRHTSFSPHCIRRGQVGTSMHDSTGTVEKSNSPCKSPQRSSPERQGSIPSGPSVRFDVPCKDTMSASPGTRYSPRSYPSSPCFPPSSAQCSSGRSISPYRDNQGAGTDTSGSSCMGQTHSGVPVCSGTSTATNELMSGAHSTKESASYYWVTEGTDNKSTLAKSACQNAWADEWNGKKKYLCSQTSSAEKQETCLGLSSHTESNLSSVSPCGEHFYSSNATSFTPEKRRGMYEKSSNARQSYSSQAFDLSLRQSLHSTATQAYEDGPRAANGKSDYRTSDLSSPFTCALNPKTSPPILKVLTAGQPKPTPKKVDFACQSPTYGSRDFHYSFPKSSLATSEAVCSDESDTSTHVLPRTSPYSCRSSPRASATTQYRCAYGPGSVQSFSIRREESALEEKSSDTYKTPTHESPNSRRRSPWITREISPVTGTASKTPTTSSVKSDFACLNVDGECQSSLYCSTPEPRYPTSCGQIYTTSKFPKADFACQNTHGKLHGAVYDSTNGHKSHSEKSCTCSMSPLEFACQSQSSRGESPGQPYRSTSGQRNAATSERTVSAGPASEKADFACQSPYGTSHFSRSSFTRSDRSSPSCFTTPAARVSPHRLDAAGQVVTNMSPSWHPDSLGQRSVPKFCITSESAKSVNGSHSDSQTSQHSYHRVSVSPQNLLFDGNEKANTHTRSSRTCTRISRSTQDSCSDSVHSTKPTPIFLDMGDASMTGGHSRFSSPTHTRRSFAHTDDHSKTSSEGIDRSGESAHRVSPGLIRQGEKTAAGTRRSVTDTSLTPPGRSDKASQDLHFDSHRLQHGSTGQLKYVNKISTSTSTSPKSDSACQVPHRLQHRSGRRPSSTPGCATSRKSLAMSRPGVECQTPPRGPHCSEFYPAQCTKKIPILCVTDESARTEQACQGVDKRTRSVQCCSIPRPQSGSTTVMPDRPKLPQCARQTQTCVSPGSKPEIKTARDSKVAGSANVNMPSIEGKLAVSGQHRPSQLSKTNATPNCFTQDSFLTPACKERFSPKTLSTNTSVSSAFRGPGLAGDLKFDTHTSFDKYDSPIGLYERTDKNTFGLLPLSITSSQDRLQRPPLLSPLLSPATASGSTTEPTRSRVTRDSIRTSHGKSCSLTTPHTVKGSSLTPNLSTIVSLSEASRTSDTVEDFESKKVCTGVVSDLISQQTQITSRKSLFPDGESLATGKWTSTTPPTFGVTSHTANVRNQHHQEPVRILSLFHDGDAEKSRKKSASRGSDYALQSRLLYRRKPSHLCENIRRALNQKFTKKSTSVMAESWRKPTILISHSGSVASENCRRLRDARQSTLSGLQAMGMEGASDSTNRNKATRDSTKGRTGGQSQQLSFSDQIIKITPCHSDYQWQECARPKISSLLRAAGTSAKMSSSCHEKSKDQGYTISSEACLSHFSSSVDSFQRPPWDSSFSSCLDREDSYSNLMVEIRQKCGPPRPFFETRRKKGARPPWQPNLIQKQHVSKSTWNAHTLNCNCADQPPWNPFFRQP